MDIEVHRCLTALTTINYTSPIGLDCKILKTRLRILDKRRGEKTIFMSNLIMLIVATPMETFSLKPK